ncbi:hypothetical protein [Virgibacillus kimchii]
MFKSVLFYTDKLKPMQRFYANVLGLDVIESDSNQFTVKVGETDLKFRQTDAPSFYHFAINIPGNQFILLKQWIRDKVPLIRSDGVLDVYYESLGADSFYFHDPAGNLVEMIGRRNRDLFGPLTKEAFINISEVGIITPHVYEVGEELQDLGVPLWNKAETDPDTVNFLGREDTFILLAPPEWKWRFSKRKAETHPLEIMLNHGVQISINTEGVMEASDTKE